MKILRLALERDKIIKDMVLWTQEGEHVYGRLSDY